MPSDGVALVQRMNLGSWPVVDESSKEVRRERKASVNWDLGWVRTLTLRSTTVMVESCSGVARLARGMRASEGSPVTPSISATLRRPVSRLSSRKARMMPMTRPMRE